MRYLFFLCILFYFFTANATIVYVKEDKNGITLSDTPFSSSKKIDLAPNVKNTLPPEITTPLPAVSNPTLPFNENSVYESLTPQSPAPATNLPPPVVQNVRKDYKNFLIIHRNDQETILDQSFIPGS